MSIGKTLDTLWDIREVKPQTVFVQTPIGCVCISVKREPKLIIDTKDDGIMFRSLTRDETKVVWDYMEKNYGSKSKKGKK